MRSLFRLVLFVASLAVVLVPGQRPAVASARADGVVSDLTWYISRAEMDRSISMMRDAGVKWIRANINWSSIEPNSKGSLDAWWLTEIDYAVAQAQAAGIQVLMPIADGVPYWASGDPKKSGGNSWNKYWKPANFQDYADFVKAIVTRYSAKGVHAYEVWNEPNYSRFWPSGPNASDYANMLKATYPAIKAADPSATVITGGVSRNDFAFVRGLYNAGAKGYFDAVGVHPYTNKVDPTSCWTDGAGNNSIDAFCGLESVRDVMVDNGDSAKTMWLTEFGWSTASGASNGVSEAMQADYLKKSFTKLDEYPWVAHAFWYSFRNNYWSNNDQSDVEANYGLLRVDFSAKSSLAAFKSVMSTSPPSNTTTTAPPTTTTSPTTTTTIPSSTDTTAPVISNVAAVKVTATAEKVTWLTNEASNSVLEVWKTGGTIRRVTNATKVKVHALTMSSLARATTYNYRVKSTDAAGNLAVSATATFRTS